jgi:diguanylate cyclase (GGDEF)-like protein
MENMIRNEVPNLKVVHNTIEKKVRADIARHISLPEQEMRLLEKLQTTLNLNELIEIFFSTIQTVVNFDGLLFENKDVRFSEIFGSKHHHNCRYSLTIEKEFLGDLTFYRRKRFSEKELSNIEVLMSAMVYPLRNAIMYKKALDAAFTDALTGAQNRASLNDTLAREIELAKRHDDKLSVILIDADHFKSINDTLGHAHGDAVLKAISSIAHDTIRQSDVLFRYGGEEFLVLLNQTDLEGAELLAHRIRQNIENIQEINGVKSTVTVSLGVTTLRGNDSLTSIFNRADKALYMAKANGRNRCEIL